MHTTSGTLIDSVEHRFTIQNLHAPTEAERVKVHDGRFWLNNAPWAPHGHNYYINYIAGQPDFALWGVYNEPGVYDPDDIDHDFKEMSEMGFTAISSHYMNSSQADNARDLVVRCQHYGLKCSLFISNARPLQYNLQTLGQMIGQARLDRLPGLFNLEGAWEPNLGPRADRARLDPDWTAWVIEQYGSLNKAFSVWGYTPPQKDGVIEGASDAQLLASGSANVMVAAYRRFADDRISRDYGIINPYIRSLCPNVLVATRTGWGGACIGLSDWMVTGFAYDLRAGAVHLDFISPEGYGLGGGNNSSYSDFEAGKVLAAYARYCGHKQANHVVRVW